jgi:hypothetical protein
MVGEPWSDLAIELTPEEWPSFRMTSELDKLVDHARADFARMNFPASNWVP